MECVPKLFAWMAIVVTTAAGAAWAQVQPGQPRPPAQQPGATQQPKAQPAVVATVNGDAITRREVDVALEQQLQGQQVDAATAQKMQQQVVNNLIESRLVEQYVVEQGPAVEEQEVAAVIERLAAQLAEQNTTLADFIASRGHTKDSFQNRIEGSLAWQKFQQQQVTEDKLQRYFNENQARFNAESLDQVRQKVAGEYVGELWRGIVSRMKPDARIEAPASRPRQQNPNPQPRPQP